MPVDTPICGKSYPAGTLKFSPAATIRSCIPVSPTHPLLVEKKYDGFRLIYEGLDDGTNAGKFFTKKQERPKFFASSTSALLNQHLRAQGINDVILDGEGFLSECYVNGNTRVPLISDQQRAINGEHPDLLRNCKFTFQVFDIIRFNQKIVTNLPLKDRKTLLKRVLPEVIEGSATFGGIQPRFAKNIAIVPVQGKMLDNIDEIVQEYCQVVQDGHEGIMIKDPDSKYPWENLNDHPDRALWWKIKDERDIDTEVIQACLGKAGEGKNKSDTLQNNTFRYKRLILGICKDEKCEDLQKIAVTGSSLKGSPLSNTWEKEIHAPILHLIKTGEARPAGEWKQLPNDRWQQLPLQWRFLDEVQPVLPHFTELIGGVTKAGRNGLPVCVNLPLHKLIVTTFTNEIQVTGQDISLRGPPRIGRLRPDKDRPNDRDYVLSLVGEK